jgi:VWFA-related protein
LLVKRILIIFVVVLSAGFAAAGQDLARQISLSEGRRLDIVNQFGRVEVIAVAAGSSGTGSSDAKSATLTARSDGGVAESELEMDSSGSRTSVTVKPSRKSKRIDLQLEVPERASVSVETADGAVTISGNLAEIRARSGTGTIAVNIPPDDVRYQLWWTESRPRFVSDLELEKVKEKSAGRFQIEGRIKPKPEDAASVPGTDSDPPGSGNADPEAAKKDTKQKRSSADSRHVELNIQTARGIFLLNVPPNEVSSDLRERPLTNAAKAIIRSGDSLLMDAIRRASPKYFGDYASTLPPMKREPTFGEKASRENIPAGNLKRAIVGVFDARNRTITDLKASDFQVLENNEEREVVSIQPVTAPFNLVLLLDVSGSVENYQTFIRKAARSFVDTVGRNDRVAIVIFNDDTKVLSGFSTNKQKLSESLDTFDAGGGTAYYDALAFTLADTLRPLKGERTAVVVLTDGDDNRSFLSFDSLLGSIQESGALIYPLYVPSALIAASANDSVDKAVDPLRMRYMSLSTKAEGEGPKLAEVSGGVYYPITQLSQIQAAYDDIVVQLRTAYTVTYRSTANGTGNGVSPRLKIKVKRDEAFVKVNSVTAVND